MRKSDEEKIKAIADMWVDSMVDFLREKLLLQKDIAELKDELKLIAGGKDDKKS